jgi:hypothetical protein
LARWFFGWLNKPKDLYIDLRRINDEDRAAHRKELYGDIEYRNRVKKRMLEGLTMDQMAPLYLVPKKAEIETKSKRKTRRRNVLPMTKTGALLLVIAIIGCNQLPPPSMRLVVERVLGASRIILIAEDGAQCRSDDYLNAEMIWRAEIGKKFECHWHPKSAPLLPERLRP